MKNLADLKTNEWEKLARQAGDDAVTRARHTLGAEAYGAMTEKRSQEKQPEIDVSKLAAAGAIAPFVFAPAMFGLLPALAVAGLLGGLFKATGPLATFEKTPGTKETGDRNRVS